MADELNTALRNAHKAGDTVAAQRIAKMIQDRQAQQPTAQPQAQAPPVQPQVEEPSLTDRLFSAISEAPETIAKQTLGNMEALASVAGGMIGTPLAGWAGLIQAANPWAEEGAGARASEGVQEFFSELTGPRTEVGKDRMMALGQGVQFVVDKFNIPVSGVGAVTELVTGQGIDQAIETMESIQKRGVGVTAGERVLEETDSPLAATIARVAPEAIAEAVAFKGARPVMQFQSETKRKIADMISRGEATADTAKFKLAEQTGTPVPRPRTRLQEALDVGGARIVDDKVAQETIRQGFDKGVIAAVKGSNPADKAKMSKMVDIMERSKKDAPFAMQNRPSDIAGDSLMERVRSVKSSNKTAGQQLDKVANSLKGQKVDPSNAVQGFLDDLEIMGVRMGKNNTPNFKGSDIEGVVGAERAINQIVKRMRDTKSPDAYDLHRLKKYIDEQVTFGKSTEGLAGKTERILKNLRRNLDETLDTSFPEYNRVNTQYSETIGALDSLQDVAGRKLDLSGPRADKATGTLLRRLMGNAQSRVPLMDAIESLEGVAKKYSPKKLDDDLMSQVLFADELDSVFGQTAKTSFQGGIERGVKRAAGGLNKRGLFEFAADVAIGTAKKARGVNPEGAYKSIKKLLKDKTP